MLAALISRGAHKHCVEVRLPGLAGMEALARDFGTQTVRQALDASGWELKDEEATASRKRSE
jgi:hypothetical protein